MRAGSAIKKDKLPPGMSPKDVEKMEDYLNKIISGSQEMNGKASWVLEHSFLVIHFHLEEDSAAKSRLLKEIGHSEERGHRLGFSQPQIRALNRAILEAREKEKLMSLYNQINNIINDKTRLLIEETKKGKRKTK